MESRKQSEKKNKFKLRPKLGRNRERRAKGKDRKRGEQ